MSSAKTLLIAVAALAAAAHLTTGEPASQTVTRTAKAPERLPLHFGLRNAAEEQFVRKFANEFSQTLAVVAANPDVSFSAGSFAAHVRSAYMQLDPSRRRTFRPGSLKLLPTTGATRPTALVRVDAQDVATLRAQPPGFSPAMRQEFRALINNRIDGFPSIVGSLTRSKSAGLIRQPKTWIEGGVFGEANAGGKQEITLNQPQVLGFKWRSEEIGARAGYWELKQAATGQLRERVLATGTTGMDMSKPGSQGFFEIDFAKYLPPKPPTLGAARYTVRIKPLPQQRREAQKVAPGGKIGPPSNAPKITPVGPPKEPDGVGPWSTYVVIHYGFSTTPPQTFHDVYRRVHLYLDSIYLVEDQYGPGAEEFSVDGFVQSYSPSGAGNQYRLGGFARLDPDGPRLHRYGGRVTFDLPSAGDFPRAYTVVLSILERDDGGMWGDWQQALWKVAREALSNEIELAMKERLTEIREKMVNDVNAETMKAAIEAFKAAMTDDYLAALLKMFAQFIISAIEGGLPDDYYGTEVITFVMPTNRADVVQNSVAFWVSHTGESPEVEGTHALTGQLLNDGQFRVKPKVVRFYGQPSYPEAGAFDGKVDVTMHWAFTNRGM